MNTVKAIMSQLTDTNTIMTSIKEIMLEVDAKYSTEEKAFQDKILKLKQALGAEKSSCVDDLIFAHNQRIASNLIFLGWSGLHLNLACSQNSVNKLLLKEDFDDIHQEHLMNSLPATHTAHKLIDDAYLQIPPEFHPLVDSIISYYSYLETVAYKLVHYLGFRLADELLYHVVPGYSHDSKTTHTYCMKLKEYCNISLI